MNVEASLSEQLLALKAQRAKKKHESTKSLSVSVRTKITERKRAKELRERAQRKLVSDPEIFHAKIADKLFGLLETKSYENFCKCGKEEIFRTCKECKNCTRFTYKCSLKWCPLCNWRITNRRAEIIKRWSRLIHNPKHIVVTQRNFPVLTRKKIVQHKRALSRLRRAKVWERVKGGCCSVEITNEGKGWHLHAHMLVDADFVSMKELAIVWGKLVDQEFGIVHYDDCSKKDYCNEVCKYVVKSSEMSDWDPNQIAEFIKAISGSRFFFPFGTFWKMQKQIKLEMEADRPEPPVCDCGCDEFFYETELQEILRETRKTR